MGRLALTWVAIGGILLTIIGLGIRVRSNDLADNALTFYVSEKAKSIATSAAQIYVRKLSEKSVTVPNSYTISSIMNGSATVNLVQVGVDTVLIRAIGLYKGHSDSAKAYCAITGRPDVNSAFGLSSASTNATLKITGAGSIIDGRNYNPTTGVLDPSAPSFDGITASGATSFTALGYKSVIGKKGGPTPPDTAWFGAAQPNYDDIPALLIPKADRVITAPLSADAVWGTWTSPEIVVVNNIGSSAKAVSGCGILIFTGSSSFTAPLDWKGLIIVASTPSLPAVFKPTQVNSFYGAVIMTGPSPTWNQSNNGYYNYSREALDHVFAAKGMGYGYKIAYWWE